MASMNSFEAAVFSFAAWPSPSYHWWGTFGAVYNLKPYYTLELITWP